MTRQAAGTLLTLVSAAGYGVLPVLFALATRTGFERHSLLAQRFLLAALLLLAGLAWRGDVRLPGRRLLACVGLGACGYAVQAWMYFTAVDLSGAGMATLLLYTYPAFVTLLAWGLRGERPDAARVQALAMALVGCLLTCTLGPLRPSLAGVLASLAGALLYALYLLVSDVVLRDVRPLAAGAWVCLGCGLAFAGLALRGGRVDLADTPGRAAFVLVLAVCCTLVPIVALFAALPRLGLARVAVVSSVEPVITLTLAALFLNERFGLGQVLGALLVVASVVVIQRDRA